MRKLLPLVIFVASVCIASRAQAGWVIEGSVGKGGRVNEPRGWEPTNVMRALETGLVDSVQVVYNIFDQSPEDELFPYCVAHDIAVIALSPMPKQSRVIGLIPTGWYPNSISFSADGKFAYVVNGKSPTGPNPGSCMGLTPEKDSKCRGTNQYNLQLIKAGLQSFPVPTSGHL